MPETSQPSNLPDIQAQGSAPPANEQYNLLEAELEQLMAADQRQQLRPGAAQELVRFLSRLPRSSVDDLSPSGAQNAPRLQDVWPSSFPPLPQDSRAPAGLDTAALSKAAHEADNLRRLAGLTTCQFCQRIDYAKLFSVAATNHGPGPSYIPRLQRKKGNPAACQLCRFLETCLSPTDTKTTVIELVPVLASLILDSKYPKDPKDLRDFTNVAVFVQILTSSVATALIDFDPSAWEPGRVLNGAYEIPMYLAARPSGPPQQSQEYQLHMGSRKHVDFSRVRNWLHDCVEHHDSSCNSPSREHNDFDVRKLHGFKVIDVHTLQVGPAPVGAKYVALSYVWGKTTRYVASYVRGTSARLANLPKTITHAIQVTMQLGEKYLWVDSVCIGQGALRETVAQMRFMCHIYAQAHCTIVALSNLNADSGLPGSCEQRPRAAQDPEIDLVDSTGSSIHLAARRIMDVDQFADNYWNTRGWTMQEAMFSRRCLCFTEEEVFLWCKSYIYREIVDQGVTRPYPKSRNWKMENRGTSMLPMRMDFASKVDSRFYMMLVTLYSARDLTYGSDALNAFGGIATRLERSGLSPVYFGIPACIFAQALLWLPRQRFSNERIKHQDLADDYFPSWSWAGMAGGVNYDHLTGEVMGIYNMPRLSNTKDATNMPAEVAEVIAVPGIDGATPEFSTSGHLLPK